MKKQGVTLIEIIVGIFVFALLSTAAYFIFSYGMKVSLYNSVRVQMQHNARIAMERLTSEAKNALRLPWDSVVATDFDPDAPPSPVCVPFYYGGMGYEVDMVPNKLYFTEAEPLTGSTNYAATFNYSDMGNYRLILYYIKNPADMKGHIENYEPDKKSEVAIGENRITELKRLTINLTSGNIGSYFEDNWLPRYITNNESEVTQTMIETQIIPSTNEVIVQMPYATDYIHFVVSHEEDPDYYDNHILEFQGPYPERSRAFDPINFKISITVVQYPMGDLSRTKQEFKLDGVIQIRSTF